MKKIYFLLVMIAAFSLSAVAKTYYAKSGGTGDGTSELRAGSLEEGLRQISAAGDTLYLLGGQYDLATTLRVDNKVGTEGKYIVISGYGNEKAILDFRKTEYGKRGLQINSSCRYLHVRNLTIRYSGKNNLYNEGSYCIFENLDIYGGGDTGCQMKVGGNNLIKNVDSHDNFDYELDKSGNLTACDFGGNADGFADKQHSGAANTYIGCRSWNNSDDGWDFFQRVTTSETLIEGCICYKNGPAYFDMRNHPRYETDKAWFDQFADGLDVVDADGNTVHVTLAKYPNMGNGNGFKLGGYYTDHKVRVQQCLSVANTVKGFDQNNNDGAMVLYNNTGYLNGTDYGFTTRYGTLTIQNCLSYKSQNPNSTASMTTLVDSYNSWNISGLRISESDFVSTDTTEILAAREADGSLREGTLLRLAAGSALIDAGVDVGLPYTGSAPDLGCYETDGIVHPSVVCTSQNAEQWVGAKQAIEPIVFQWGGNATKLTCSDLPEGITYKISNNNKTLTLSGTPAAAGTYTIAVRTVSESDEVATAEAVLHVKSEQAHRVAYVTLPNSAEDQVLLAWLRSSDSIVVTETDATDNTVDYTGYEVLVLGAKPNSGAAGLQALRGIAKPIVLLKPFLLKTGVWGWGTPQNTQDTEIVVMDTEHALWDGITVSEEGTITLFEQCRTNAVTAISAWAEPTEGVIALGSPASHEAYTAVAELPAGATVGGTLLAEPMVMIGVSEYSTAYLTEDGTRLIENAIYYLLGMRTPSRPTGVDMPTADQPKAVKVVTAEGVLIRYGEVYYTLLGQPLYR